LSLISVIGQMESYSWHWAGQIFKICIWICSSHITRYNFRG